ncbi:MAG: hypothetical protein WC810_01100 [Janthinobacterium sp.]|jgi:hypothetical protein
MESIDLLLAFKVRELAVNRLIQKANNEGFNYEDFLHEDGMEPFIAGVVSELKVVASLIKKHS